MRRMSFSATTEQMHNRTKTVTRRGVNTWAGLSPGDEIMAIEKGMGLAEGEKQVPIGVIEIVSNQVEPLGNVNEAEARLEGFGSLSEFVAVWDGLNGGWHEDGLVRRIQFRHSAKDEGVKE